MRAALVVAALLLACDAPQKDTAAAAASTAQAVQVGQHGYLTLPSDPTARVIVFASKEGYDESTKAVAANDRVGFAQAAQRYGVALGARTRVLVIESTWTGGVRVRVEGGSHDGEAYWASRERVVREQ